MDKSPEAFRTISEVSDWLNTPAHVLRFWESRFTQLKPVKRAGGRRYYRPGDMALLGGIKKLLHDDGLTIRGVQKILREQGVRYVAAQGPETLAAGEAALAPRTADIVLDEAEYGTPGVIVAWQQDRARDTSRDTSRDQGRHAAPPLEQAPEAPMHVDAPEISDAPLTAALYTLPNRDALAELPAEDLADLEFVWSGAGDSEGGDSEGGDSEAGDSEAGDSEAGDMAIPAELEGEWAALLAQEAAGRSPVPSSLDPERTNPVQPDLFSLDEEEPMVAHPPPAADQAAADLAAADLAAAAAVPVAAKPHRARPPRHLPADSDPEPGPPPLAALVRHVQAGKSLVQAAELRPLYTRLIDLRNRRSLPMASDRQ